MNIKTVKLKDVCDLITCGVAKKPDYTDKGIPFLSARNVKNQKIIWNNFRFISPKTHKELTKYNKPILGDILYTRVGSYGEAAIVDKDIEFSVFVSLTLIKPKANLIYNKYLVYFLNSPIGKSLAKKGINSSGVGNLNVSVVRNFDIPLPSLDEQQRITTKLDAVFAEIDKTTNISKKKITYIENIYESFLTSAYEKCKSTPDYQEKFFGNIIETLTDYHANGSYQTLKKHVELKNEKDFAYMVRSTDFEKNFTNNKRYISKAAYEFLNKSKVFGGEIIMSKIGNAGKVYLMPKISYPCSLAMNLFLIKLDESQSSNEFIYNFLKSKSGKIQISQRIKGAATQTITKDNVRSIKVPLVKKELQKKIVSKIYVVRKNITKIKKNLIKKLDLLFKLKETLIADLIHS